MSSKSKENSGAHSDDNGIPDQHLYAIRHYVPSDSQKLICIDILISNANVLNSHIRAILMIKTKVEMGWDKSEDAGTTVKK